jgi:hypothetical protein
VNILNNLLAPLGVRTRKLREGARFGLVLAAASCWSSSAAAEVLLFEKDGWHFAFDGRVNAFLSVGQGDDFPSPTPNPNTPGVSHNVQGSNKPPGTPDVGWKSAEVQDKDGKYFAMRVRSGMISNVLGFGLTRDLGQNTNLRGYISIWSTIETLGRDKWAPVIPEAREGYASVNGPWGTATIGRTWGWFGRTSAEIDLLYGHGYGVGLPCTDELGPSCGHIGTGVAYPGYSAGFAYSTPSLGGLKVHVGLYDPIVLAPEWKRAPLLRPEGAVTFETELGGSGKLKIGVEGLYQPLGRVATDEMTMQAKDESTSVWGAAGGARLELGPVRLGAAAFRGRGIGMGYALQYTSAIVSPETYELRSFSGVYGQGGLALGKLQLTVGGGMAAADQLSSDRINPTLSVIHRQIGISAALYYEVSDSVVLGLDYFRFMASWYGAPASTLDPVTNEPVITTTAVLAGEKQDLNFVNAGVTYHW